MFKIGGTANISRALISTLIDIAISIAAMQVTIGILLPKLFYTRKQVPFAGTYLLLIFIC
jgi:hypothetical protein